MKKFVTMMLMVACICFSCSAFTDYETNDEEHIKALCCMISEKVEKNNLYVIDGRVLDRNGKSVGFSFPGMSTLSSYKTSPKNIFFYTKSIDEFPEYKTMKSPRVYKIRRILARKVISQYGRVHFDGKSESKTNGFIIDVRDLYSLVGNDDELFIKTIVSGNRARMEVRKDISPSAFCAVKSSSFAVAYDCECRIDDYYNYEFNDCEDTHWSVRIHAKYKGVSETFSGYIQKNTKEGEYIYSILKDGESHNLNLTIRYPKTKRSSSIVQILSINKGD